MMQKNKAGEAGEFNAKVNSWSIFVLCDILRGSESVRITYFNLGCVFQPELRIFLGCRDEDA
jgi:hypothetical protein